MELALGEKGPIAPAPKLSGVLQLVVSQISDWKDVISATHWHLYQKGKVDGIDFYVNEHELGHIHLNGDVHLATNKLLRDPLVNNHMANRFPYRDYDNWVMFTINGEQDIEQACWLFQLNYMRLQHVDDTTLLTSIEKRVNEI